MRVLAFCLFFTGLFLPAAAAFADGIYLPPEDEGIARLADMTSPDQHVILVDRGETQEMVVRVVVRGAPETFAWVLPLPAAPSQPPEVFDNGDAVFQQLYQGTAPEWVEAEDFFSGFGCGDKGLAGTSGDSESVELLGRTFTGDLVVDTLEASSGTALQQWLKDNRFLVPGGLAELAQPYVDDGWVFLAMKLATGFEEQDARLQVLHLTWPGEKPVFPLRLTRLNAQSSKTHVALFVFADTRTDLDKMGVKFAGTYGSLGGPDLCYEFDIACLEDGSPEEAFVDSLSRPSGQDPFWVTRLEGDFTQGDMDDLHPEPTESKAYRETRTYSLATPRAPRGTLLATLAVLALAAAEFGLLKAASAGRRGL